MPGQDVTEPHQAAQEAAGAGGWEGLPQTYLRSQRIRSCPADDAADH